MFADMYIFVCGACDNSFPPFFKQGSECVCECDHGLHFGGVNDTFSCPACLSKSTNLYMYIDKFDTFIHVCQGFDKESCFGTTGVCQRIKYNLWQLQKLSRILFIRGLFIVEIKMHLLFSGSYEIF